MSLKDSSHNVSRRGFLCAASAGLAASVVSPAFGQDKNGKSEIKPIRWGFVGTGGIATSTARALKDAPNAVLSASSSRTLSKAEAFSGKHKAEKAFGSWAEMFEWEGIDAIYVATPTFVKEEISIAAAKAGKHVLCEKPLPSMPGLNRILAACRENNVAFMDGTHFSHHPRSVELESKMESLVGKRRTLHSVFQFNVRNQDNIRLNPTQEPMGALGDAGWYNIRAIVDYLEAGVELNHVSAVHRRDPQTDAVLATTAILSFSDGSVSTFTCAIDAGTVQCVARVDGDEGSVEIPRFVLHDKDNSASYTLRKKGKKGAQSKVVKVPAPRPDAAIMFEDFAKQIHDPALRKKWEQKAVRTQTLLDATWESGLTNEKK